MLINIKVQILESDLILQTPVFPDSLPTVLIDSLTLNKPVVSTDLGGCAEILNYGKNGILDKTHTRLFTFSSFRNLLTQSGFKIKMAKTLSESIGIDTKEDLSKAIEIWDNK